MSSTRKAETSPKGARVGLLVTCEHGGNRVPTAFSSLFRDHASLLDSHRGIDFGSLVMAQSLARQHGAPKVTSDVTRLLVDLNRSVGHPRLFSEVTRTLPSGARDAIIEQYWQPYRRQVDDQVESLLAERRAIVHISCHSFTPVLAGRQRQTDIGLLYDPARPWERALCIAWQQALQRLAPALRVRRNYPYEGRNDGLTRTLRKRLPDACYAGIELEVNQAISRCPPDQWRTLRRQLGQTLASVARLPRSGSLAD
ncbi:MAG: N-formylglutamate amidohydrolase [Gammaproteobacteria bacterium]|nr:N-formylglutamate amidohydrolase [Gammaproteobacteria bacterium]